MRSVGSRPTAAGITLVELLVVMAIVSLMMALAFPNVTSGLEGIRLKMTADRVGSFWAEARQRADRYQEVVQVSVDPEKRELRALGAETGWSETFPVVDGLLFADPKQARSYLIYPGTPSPEFSLLLAGSEGGRAGVKVNILTGVPEEWNGSE